MATHDFTVQAELPTTPGSPALALYRLRPHAPAVPPAQVSLFFCAKGCGTMLDPITARLATATDGLLPVGPAPPRCVAAAVAAEPTGAPSAAIPAAGVLPLLGQTRLSSQVEELQRASSPAQEFMDPALLGLPKQAARGVSREMGEAATTFCTFALALIARTLEALRNADTQNLPGVRISGIVPEHAAMRNAGPPPPPMARATPDGAAGFVDALGDGYAAGRPAAGGAGGAAGAGGGGGAAHDGGVPDPLHDAAEAAVGAAEQGIALTTPTVVPMMVAVAHAITMLCTAIGLETIAEHTTIAAKAWQSNHGSSGAAPSATSVQRWNMGLDGLPIPDGMFWTAWRTAIGVDRAGRMKNMLVQVPRTPGEALAPLSSDLPIVLHGAGASILGFAPRIGLLMASRSSPAAAIHAAASWRQVHDALVAAAGFARKEAKAVGITGRKRSREEDGEKKDD